MHHGISFATEVLLNGDDVFIVQEFMGKGVLSTAAWH